MRFRDRPIRVVPGERRTSSQVLGWTVVGSVHPGSQDLLFRAGCVCRGGVTQACGHGPASFPSTFLLGRALGFMRYTLLPGKKAIWVVSFPFDLDTLGG